MTLLLKAAYGCLMFAFCSSFFGNTIERTIDAARTVPMPMSPARESLPHLEAAIAMSKRHPVQQSFERSWPPFFACIAGSAPDDFRRGCGRHGDSTRSRIPAAITFVTAWDE